MRVSEYNTSTQTKTVTDLVIIMDNGERVMLTERRPSASQCELEVIVGGSIKIMPVDKHTVRIGRE